MIKPNTEYIAIYMLYRYTTETYGTVISCEGSILLHIEDRGPFATFLEELAEKSGHRFMLIWSVDLATGDIRIYEPNRADEESVSAFFQ